MALVIIAFVVGVFIGYKYPQQVKSTMESGKKLFNDLKGKLSKKRETPGP